MNRSGKADAVAAASVGVDSLAVAAAAVAAAVDFPAQQGGVQDPGSNRLLGHLAVVVAVGPKSGSAAQGASRGQQEDQIECSLLLAAAAAVAAEQELRNLGVNHKQRPLEEGDHKLLEDGQERGRNESALPG